MWREKLLFLYAVRRDTCVMASVSVFFGVIIVSCLAVNYAIGQTIPIESNFISRQTHDVLIQQFESQVSLLKWIGVAIVTSLSAAVALLYRALERANADSRGDLISGIKRREEILEEQSKVIQSSNDALRSLSENIERLLKATPNP